MTHQIVTVSTGKPQPDYFCYDEFLQSVRRHGDEVSTLVPQTWGGLMTKPRQLRGWLRNGLCKADCLIVVDCWDLVFASDPSVIVSDWEAIGRPWLMGAERNLFPAGDESRYPKCASSYRFPNSGVVLSTPSDMLAVLEHMNLDSIPDDHQSTDGTMVHENDQFYYQKAFLDQPIPMHLDTECKFVWNLCGVDQSNFEFQMQASEDESTINPRILNRETGTFPHCFHFNGGSKTDPPGMQSRILHHLGLR